MEYDFLCIMIIINKVDWENLNKEKEKLNVLLIFYYKTLLQYIFVNV